MNIAVDPRKSLGKPTQNLTAAERSKLSSEISASCLTALACLAVAMREMGVELNVARLVRLYAREGDLSALLLAQIAKREGIESAIHSLDWVRLNSFRKSTPFLARLTNGEYVTVLEIPQSGPQAEIATSIRIFNPRVGNGQAFSVAQQNFVAHWSGEIILLRRKVSTETKEIFGLRWFVAQFWKHKGLLYNIAGAALLLHILSLAVPIFFQIVVDRVLVYLNVSTLIVITCGVAAAILFDTILTWLRGYFILNAAAKMDMQLARLSFEKLVSLPMSFFDRSRAGVVTRHMQQATQIREFLTGRLLTTILDLPALIILLPLLLWYSPILTGIVLGATVVMASAIALMIGPYRRRLLSLYATEANRQSLLVESIHGMRTIKALGLEARREKTWNDCSATSIRNYQNVGAIALTTNAFSGFMEKALAVLIVVAGTFLVFSNHLSVGGLVAFNMLAMRLTAPIMQVIGLLNNYQETLLSVDMLGHIMNEEDEGSSSCLAPELFGDIEFDQVTFCYPGSDQPVLRDVSLRIPAGSLVGIVGRSGSGKTTLSSLLQGLNRTTEGSIRIDGYNVEDLDLGHLRGQLGVVPQEAFLFRGTIRENIQMGRENASFENVVQAARLAGADEFIQRLPRRYESELEENGVNLSGGQKQRLAIARAILRDPKIMIFDEATSALDPDSEAAVMENLRRMAAGRTTILVSHRLYTVRDADIIIVMGDGRILDMGTHDELFQRNNVYKGLWAQQGLGA